ncbi:HAMP domain-containing histidine kinase [Shimwellia pseudoproteus]|uniref:sensor histidine kinase n=1 Tax=Shimwellia pseudoproteus TaxID=570012 RepID=UPI0018ECEDE6|nr:HAMP domain-containing sensor histidine kinase [Shimwellia pseudoproteus]MBJ3816344.1 HAMP domain-containing histidine kinase [Shimwellia pseudoproteus]
MARLNLSQRLALVFTGLLLLCALAACMVQLHSSRAYGNAMIQRLSLDLAGQITASEALLSPAGAVNRQTLSSLFDRLMTLNPSVELYLLAPDGRLLADAAPAGHLKRQKVAIAPIHALLGGKPLPIYGDDPRSRDRQKVFSAAPVYRGKQLTAYLYIILQGETLNALSETAWHNALRNALLWSLLLVAALGGVAAALASWWVTRPVKALTRQMSVIDGDSIHTIRLLAAQPLRPGEDEVSRLHNSFMLLARKIVSQWDALADSDRQRREFIATISHDLRTPLTSLLGYLETLSVKAATLTPEERQQYFAVALRQGNNVRHLSQQLFELARLEYGGITPRAEAFAAPELIQDILQKYDLSLESRHLALQVDIPPRLPVAWADLSMIERVLTNLLDNAVRHTPEGGVISLHCWPQGGHIMVEIQDSGPGIPDALRDGLFQRPSILEGRSAGTPRGGLGLMIVRRMLELHGCHIELVERGAGACFRFSVPCRG